MLVMMMACTHSVDPAEKREAKARMVARIARLSEFRDAVCKCPKGDAACAMKALDDDTSLAQTWTKEAADDLAKLDRADGHELERMLTPLVDAYNKCMQAALHGDTPSASR